MDQPGQLKSVLEFSEARFEAIAQTATDSIIISDENSIIIFANKKAYEIFGYAEGSLIGLDLAILMPEKYRQWHRAGVQRFIDTGNPKLIGHTIEVEGLRKDGTAFPLELSLSSWKEEGNYYFSGIIRDITQRKEFIKENEAANKKLQDQQKALKAANEELKAAREQLRKTNEELEHRVAIRTRELVESERKVKRSEEQLRLITDAMPVLISYVRKDKTYAFVNKAYETLYKRKKEEIIGRPVWETIGIKAYNNSLTLIERALEGECVESEALQDYSEAGRKWVNISLVPHKVEGEIVGFFALVEDITAFKNIQFEQEELLLKLNEANKEKERALKQLEEKNQDLERVNTDLDNFVYTASHDLKSPITNLEGLMALLKRSVFVKAAPEERKIIEMMDTSIQRLQRTIGGLVEITKAQKGMEGSEEELLRFEEISKEVKEDIHNLIRENGAVIKEDFKVENIQYKKRHLRSILYNLLSNAVKYRSSDRPLEVELKTCIQNGFIVLSVKDSGVGLSKEQQKKLFTLFRRMHQHIEGTGVGLFTIKRIIENNRGSIEVRSEEGKGTEFLVYLTKTEDSNII